MPTRACLFNEYVECPSNEPPSSSICLGCSQTVDRTARNDKISHPSYYVDGRKFEPKDVIRDWGLNYNLGCVVKYVSRAGRKDDIIQDLKKARQYLDFEIEALEKEKHE